mgnify:FL=1
MANTPNLNNSKRRSISRLVRFAGRGSTPSTSPTLEPLLRTVKSKHPKADLDLLVRAYEVAEK